MKALFLLLLMLVTPLEAASQRVGQPLRLSEVYIPGGEVKPTPRRDREPALVVRLLEVKPAKDGFRYDFEIEGMDAGLYDLADYLVTADGSKPEVGEIGIEITSGLEDGPVLVHESAASQVGEMGGYRTKLAVVAGIWVAGLGGILWWMRKKKQTVEDGRAIPPGFAERIRPLVEKASQGNLDASSRAVLERLLIGHWREKLPEIAGLKPGESMVRLKAHPESAPLFQALERWLHAPEHASGDEIETLLIPYR